LASRGSPLSASGRHRLHHGQEETPHKIGKKQKKKHLAVAATGKNQRVGTPHSPKLVHKPKGEGAEELRNASMVIKKVKKTIFYISLI